MATSSQVLDGGSEQPTVLKGKKAGAELDYYISEIDRLLEKMRVDDIQIQRDAAETRAILKQLDTLLPG